MKPAMKYASTPTKLSAGHREAPFIIPWLYFTYYSWWIPNERGKVALANSCSLQKKIVSALKLVVE